MNQFSSIFKPSSRGAESHWSHQKLVRIDWPASRWDRGAPVDPPTRSEGNRFWWEISKALGAKTTNPGLVPCSACLGLQRRISGVYLYWLITIISHGEYKPSTRIWWGGRGYGDGGHGKGHIRMTAITTAVKAQKMRSMTMMNNSQQMRRQGDQVERIQGHSKKIKNI